MENDMKLAQATASADDHAKLTLMLLGRDDVDKPHAAAFVEDDAELAAKAADLMSMHVVKVETDEMAGLARQLALGKVFASGKAFVPFVRAPLYEQVLAAAGITEPDWDTRAAARAASVNAKASAKVIRMGEAAGGKPAALGARPGAGKRPPVATGWDSITVGSLVLAPDEGQDAGWWEAVVEEQRNEHTFVLRWYAWPDEDPIIRRRDNLALLPSISAMG